METEIIEVKNPSPQYYLEQLLRDSGYLGFLPSNRIINKRRPAIGATHCELTSKRHSIIIEPFITVIEVKKIKFGDAICAVIKDVTCEDITTYLNDRSIIFKKIVTTPESFGKVIRALNTFDRDYRKHFFLLIDECEKLVQHASFRNRIYNPIDEFFNFESKALISATPITPSDPRFTIQGFKKLDILPTFDYKHDITLIATNNIRSSLRNVLDILRIKDDDRPIFLFTNCKRSILYFTRLPHVKESFKVFCAEDLDIKFFQKNHVLNVQYSVVDQEYAKFNAFTSRFFAAVDMHPSLSPHVIIITNVPFVPHSMVDPQTEAIQIFGRARNVPASITHITNFFPSGLNEDVDTDKELYFIRRLQDKCSKSVDENERAVINSLIDKELASIVLTPDGAIQPFLKDHYYFNKANKRLYALPDLLAKAYSETEFFKPVLVQVSHKFSDLDELNLESSKSGIARNKEYIRQLNALLDRFEEIYFIEPAEYHYHLERLQKDDTFLYNSYMELGLQELANLGFSKSRIKEKILKRRKDNPSLHFQMIDEILSSFKLNVKTDLDQIITILQAIYDKYNFQIKPGVIKVAKGTDIEKYFIGKPINGKIKTNGVYRTYYRLVAPLDKIASDIEYLSSS